ncbi:MAG: hypothetical protein AAF403_04600, partial [Pseudomonadota bacterium]
QETIDYPAMISNYLIKAANSFDPIEVEDIKNAEAQTPVDIHRDQLMLEIMKKLDEIEKTDDLLIPASRIQKLEPLLTFMDEIMLKNKDQAVKQRAPSFIKILLMLNNKITNLEIADYPQKPLNMVHIASSLAQLGEIDVSQELTRQFPLFLPEIDQKYRTKAISHYAKSLYILGQQNRLLEIFRLTNNPLDQGYALTSFASFRNESGDINSVQPLFLHAKSSAYTIENDIKNFDQLMSHIALQQAKADLLADAFVSIGEIKDQETQVDSLIEMGQFLIRIGRLNQAEKLIDYINEQSKRAQYALELAQHFYKQSPLTKQHQQYILEAFRDTGVNNYPDRMFETLLELIDMQKEIGDVNNDKFILQRSDEIVKNMQSPYKYGIYLTKIVGLLNARGDVDNARRQLNAVNRLFLEITDPKQTLLLQEALVFARLNIDDLLSAFDTAARIPPPENIENIDTIIDPHTNQYYHARFKSLTAVAKYAARNNDLELANGVANAIETEFVRTHILSHIAVAATLGNRQLPDYALLFK